MNLLHRTRTFCASLIILTICASVSYGQVVIGNLAGFNNDSGTPSTITGSTGKGIGFTIGSLDYTLDSVTLRLDATDPVDNLAVSIWSADVDSTPGSLLITLDNPGSFTGVGNYDFTANAAFSFDSNTSYYLIVTAPGGGSNPLWLNGSPTVTATGPGATLDQAIFGPSANIGSWTSTSSNINWFQVNGVQVPEPGSASLGALAFGLIAFMRRRSRFHNKA